MQKATPLEIAAYGHIAAFLRQQIRERGMAGPADINELIGSKRHSPMVYKWVAAKTAPSPPFRQKLADAFGVGIETFTPRVVKGLGNGAADRPKPAPAQDPLMFSVQADGQARIRLDLALPLEQGQAMITAILQLMRNRAVERVETVDWGDAPPPSAPESLQ